MEQEALYFDNNYETYSSIRPEYPAEIYKIISRHKFFDKNSNILEIGAGNGQASQEIYNKWKTKLTLIEPGNNFCDVLSERFKNIKEIKIVNTNFEQYKSEILFDAIFSATAFHWCDTSVKYKKSYEQLKDDGLLILYWNYYGIENTELENEIQKIYVEYGMGANDGKSGYERQVETIEKRRKEIVESNLFKIKSHKILKKIIEYTATENTKLLKTFPDHSKLDESFFTSIEEIIKRNGNKISRRITTNLEIGVKS